LLLIDLFEDFDDFIEELLPEDLPEDLAPEDLPDFLLSSSDYSELSD
jgi:hypothetical protein